jgi:myo-inositol-1(or 4)-monophosphatase
LLAAVTSGPGRGDQELAAIALTVAREAATLLTSGYRTRPEPTKKAPTDLVTAWDLASERLLRRRLAELTPEMGFFAEEGGGVARDGVVWVCDPLDGTTNYVHGHPFWCVSVAAMRAAEPLAGAVVAPALALEWQGWHGGPALRNGEACHVSETGAIGDALLATGFPVDRSSEPGNNFRSFVRVKQTARAVRRCGSAAIDLCMVADGTYDGYWERLLHVWDLAAACVIARAAGATITALDGSPSNLEIGHVLATNGRIHSAMIELLR